MKICFVTCSFANSLNQADKIVEFDRIPNVDYYMFTNLSINSISWTPIYISNSEFTCNKNVTRSRYGKFMAWQYFQQHNMHYDVIIYCDSIYQPRSNLKLFEPYIDKAISSESGIFQITHKSNVFRELELIKHGRKDNHENCAITKTYLIEQGMEKNDPMFGNTVFVYDPNNTKLQEAFSRFWDIYSKEKLTHRDQPIWALISKQYSIKPVYDTNDKGYPHSPLLKHFKESKKGFNNHMYVPNKPKP